MFIIVLIWYSPCLCFSWAQKRFWSWNVQFTIVNLNIRWMWPISTFTLKIYIYGRSSSSSSNIVISQTCSGSVFSKLSRFQVRCNVEGVRWRSYFFVFKQKDVWDVQNFNGQNSWNIFCVFQKNEHQTSILEKLNKPGLEPEYFWHITTLLHSW